MRVALLSHNAQAGDAIGNQVAERLRFFLARGADVRVLVEADQRLHPEVRACCWICPGGKVEGVRWKFLASADLVVVEYGQHYRLLELLPLLADGRARILFHYHGVTPAKAWGRLSSEVLQRGEAWRSAVWCADAALVNSRFTAEELCRATGFPASSVTRLGHSLDLSRWRPVETASAFREKLVQGPAHILLFVGRLAPNKRVPLIVQALAILGQRNPPVHAVVIGDTSDVYETEAQECRRLAETLGVADRLHILGHVDSDNLHAAYGSADVFVMPSVHEGFCIPVTEALASRLPVVAARAGALPETVGPAGLTCIPDDANDLARQVGRILDGLSSPENRREPVPAGRQRVAIVAFRYGTDFVGGAEASLRVMAEALQVNGTGVEVFTTCTRAEAQWSNQLPEGTSTIGGLPVHRFRIDEHDRDRHLESFRAIVDRHSTITPAMEAEYVRHSVHSSGLIEALRRRQDEFDAILVTPYLHGLTYDVARTFPAKTLLVPCFHEEPLAYLNIARATYEQVGGIVCNSPEEQHFMESVLGLNHPGTVVADTFIDQTPGDPERGRRMVGIGRRYVVYCGRFSMQKGLPPLLDYATRYVQSQADRFTFVFMGQGEVPIPRAPWARNLGFVSEADKRDVLAGADLLIQLSPYESLSLVALEAFTQGVPVLGNARCGAVRGLIERTSGGRVVDSYQEFEAALNDLFQHPAPWKEQGRCGQAYVRDRYGNQAALARALQQAVADLRRPLCERLRGRAKERVRIWERERWSEQFGAVVEGLLDRPRRPMHLVVAVRPRTSEVSAPVGQTKTLLAVQLINQGTVAAFPSGPARVVVRCRLMTEDGSEVVSEQETALPAPIAPGQSLSAVVPITVPSVVGHYQARIWAARVDQVEIEQATEVTVLVTERFTSATTACGPLLAAVQAALVEAHAWQQLPENYHDVTQGWLARGKRWLKRKLLNNFKRAYVDVLSRQQSAFNARVLAALNDLAQTCATLDQMSRLRGQDEISQESLRRLAQKKGVPSARP